MTAKPKHMTSEMNIGHAGRRPRLKPWIVLLKWTETADGCWYSHDYRWKIVDFAGDWVLYGLSPSQDTWDGRPGLDCYLQSSTVKSLMLHAQDYSDGFRKHIYDAIQAAR